MRGINGAAAMRVAIKPSGPKRFSRGGDGKTQVRQLARMS
jgi:hypothetical protein